LQLKIRKKRLTDLTLTTFDNDQFLLWRGSGENNLGVILDDTVQILFADVTQRRPVHDSGLGLPGMLK